MAKRDLTGYILNYLLDNYFDSKADMARKLDMNKRILQRIINDAVQVMQMEIPFVLPRCDGYRNQVIIEKLRTIHTHFNEFEYHEYSYVAVS